MNCSFSPSGFGFLGVASVSPEVEIGNPLANIANILKVLERLAPSGAGIIVTPELSVSGYTCADLFFQASLIEASEQAIMTLCQRLDADRRLVVVGAPLLFHKRLYNCAVFVQGGEILAAVPKQHIPNYQEFYEKRWFASGAGILNQTITIGEKAVPFGTDILVDFNGVLVGAEICEDLWVPKAPSIELCRRGAQVIINLSATDDYIGKYEYIKRLVASQSGRCRCVYAYASAGKGESSTDLVFSGINLIAADGEILAETKRFSEEDTSAVAIVDIERLKNDRRKFSTFFDGIDASDEEIRIVRAQQYVPEKPVAPAINPHPFIPSDFSQRESVCREIVSIQSWGLAQRIRASRCNHIVVGISGGLDSTLALLVAHYTLKRMGLDTRNIHGITMPALATSSRTRSNAHKLMSLLGVDSREIEIRKAVEQHFSDIGHNPEVMNATYENTQARERTQILMDLANEYNGLVLGTGDMSELALGWCTYNGDHMSMYNVNGGVPKTLVKYLVKWFADEAANEDLKNVLYNIIDTPISPELIPAKKEDAIEQKTEDLVGPYELHDFFLYHVLRNGYSPSKIMYMASMAFEGQYNYEVIKKWLGVFYRRFFTQQFKRSCMPDGPKVGSVCLSPRGDWRMPSDASMALWMKEVEKL